MAVGIIFGVGVPFLGVVTPYFSDKRISGLQRLQTFFNGSFNSNSLQTSLWELERENQELRKQLSAISAGGDSSLPNPLPLSNSFAAAAPPLAPPTPLPAPAPPLPPPRPTSPPLQQIQVPGPVVPKSAANASSASKAAAFTPSQLQDMISAKLSWAKSLKTGRCDGTGSTNWDGFKKKRFQIAEIYRRAAEDDTKAALAFGAIDEFEACGAEVERTGTHPTGHKVHDPKKSDRLRKDLFAKINQAHAASWQVYVQARAQISDMMKQKSVKGRLRRPVAKRISQGNWVIDKRQGLSCVETCHNVGQHCDVRMMEHIVSKESVAIAAEAAGHRCIMFEELMMYVAWDGPWLRGMGHKQGTCGWSEFAFTDCNRRVGNGFSRICACNETAGPKIAKRRDGMFAFLIPAIPLGPDLAKKGASDGNEDRALVGPRTLKALGSACVIYCFGVAYQFGYEWQLAEHGCTIHSFDCTMLDSQRIIEYLKNIAVYPNINYHPWCIGEHSSKYKGWDGKNTGIFLRLEEIMVRLGHTHVDLMKFDIEGNEWNLFDLLLKTHEDLLPNQIAFELHTYGANQGAVPQNLVGDKGMPETAKLFERLYKAGYALVAKEVNIADPSCAEFVMVRVGRNDRVLSQPETSVEDSGNSAREEPDSLAGGAALSMDDSHALDAPTPEAEPFTPDTSTPSVIVVPWAKRLNTGLCKQDGNSKLSVLKAKRQKVFQRYLQESGAAFMTIESVFGAVHEFEACSAHAEQAWRNSRDPAKDTKLRQDLLDRLRRVHTKHPKPYESARAKITAMMKYKSVNGRLQRPVVENISQGHWVIDGKQALSCDTTCKHVSKVCDVQMMEHLVSEKAVAAAVAAAGHACNGFEEVIFYTPWDGPWWRGPKSGGVPIGRCSFSEFAYTDCSKQVGAGFHRLCACTAVKGGPSVAHPRKGMFNHIIPALPLGHDLNQKGAGQGNEDRDLVGPGTLKALGQACIVYCFGVAYQFGYEQKMASLGCTVHSFDCTMLDNKRLQEYLRDIAGWPNIIYHPWCIGEHGSSYKGWDGQTTGIFLHLEEIMERLGHTAVDLMKFDIEGNEWNLFDVLLKTKEDLLPYQLAFEVHTYGANNKAVPQNLVGNKGMRETAELFDRLYGAGYMVVAKEINIADPSCAEFVMVRI